MPTITQNTSLEITPDRFVRSCSDVELYELWMIMQTPAIQQKLRYMDGAAEEPEPVQPRKINNRLTSYK